MDYKYIKMQSHPTSESTLNISKETSNSELSKQLFDIVNNVTIKHLPTMLTVNVNISKGKNISFDVAVMPAGYQINNENTRTSSMVPSMADVEDLEHSKIPSYASDYIKYGKLEDLINNRVSEIKAHIRMQLINECLFAKIAKQKNIENSIQEIKIVKNVNFDEYNHITDQFNSLDKKQLKMVLSEKQSLLDSPIERRYLKFKKIFSAYKSQNHEKDVLVNNSEADSLQPQ